MTNKVIKKNLDGKVPYSLGSVNNTEKFKLSKDYPSGEQEVRVSTDDEYRMIYTAETDDSIYYYEDKK